MSTLFESYTDTFGHDLYIGSMVVAKTSKGYIYGHVTKFLKDKNNENICEIVPDLGHSPNIRPKKSYKIREINIFTLNIIKK